MDTLQEYRDTDLYFHHSLQVEPNPAGTSFQAHFHDRFELYYFLSGEGFMMVEGATYPLQPGMFLIMRPGETHAMHISPGKPYERIAVLFQDRIFTGELKGLCDFFAARPLGSSNAMLDDDGFVRTCLEHMLSAASKRLSAICNLAAILDFCRAKSGIEAVSHGPEQDLVREMISYIHSHLTENWNLDTLEAVFFHDKAYLNRRFRAVTGSSIWNYTIKKRIIAARQNLFLSDSVSQAFAASGFGDYSTFYRQYVAMFGISPAKDLAAYRQQKQ